VLLVEEFIPDPPVLLGLHEDQLQAKELFDLARHLYRRGHTSLQALWPPSTGLRPRPGEDKVSSALQHTERFDTPAVLPVPPCVHKAELVTETVGQFGTVHVRALSQVLTHPLDAGRLR
jgi:hypothetical protein